jgi:hypothetical protein
MRTFDPGYLDSGAFYGVSPTIQVVFPSNWPSYFVGYTDESGLNAANTFTALSATQQQGVRTALQMWSNYTDIKFTDASTADGKKISCGFTSLDPFNRGVGYYPV